MTILHVLAAAFLTYVILARRMHVKEMQCQRRYRAIRLHVRDLVVTLQDMGLGTTYLNEQMFPSIGWSDPKNIPDPSDADLIRYNRIRSTGGNSPIYKQYSRHDFTLKD